MPRKETKVLIAILSLANLVVLILWMGIFSFTKSQVADTVLKENQIKAEIVNQETAFLMKNDVKYGKDYENNLNSYVVASDGTSDLIKNMEDLAATSSLSSNISSIDYVESGSLSSLGMELVEIDMNTTGTWKNTNLFLNLLENYPLKIDIKNTSLALVSGPASKVPQWSGDFEFTVVKFK